jgi:glycosyltransferase involved in cell wall biosynthesis
LQVLRKTCKEINILLIHQYFKTPLEGGGIRSYYIAKSLVEKGHKITILTSSNTNSGVKSIEGIRIVYFPIQYENSFGFLKRVISFMRFVIACRKYLKRDNRYDLAYVLTTPLTTAYIALHLKKRYAIPYAFEVGDLWPAVPIQLGIIKNKFIKRYLLGLEKKVYKEAYKLIALSPAIKSHMQKVVMEKEVEVIPNMSDCGLFEKSKAYVATQTLKICYFGAISYANHISFLLEAAKLANTKGLDIEFHVMGFGGLRQQMLEASKGLKNVIWHPPGGMDSVRGLLKSCHATYISYLDHHILNTGSPNKFFDGLAAGHLIIVNFEGWIKELIEKEHCGFSYNPRNPDEFIQKITKYMSSPDLFSESQKNSRRLAEKNFEVRKLTSNLHQFLDI